MRNVAAYLVILFILLFFSVPTGRADGIKAVNGMGDSIVSLECVMPGDNTRKVMGVVPNGQSATLNLYGCDRMILRWAGLVTQFFIEEPVIDGQTLTFSFSSLDLDATLRHPILTVSDLNGEKIIPGGLPFDFLVSSMEDGLPPGKLDKLLPPPGRPVRDPKKYAVSLAESSWRILYDSLEFAAQDGGPELLRSLAIESDYTSPVVLMTLAHLKGIGADPYVALTNSEILPLRDDVFSDPDYAAISDSDFETDTFQKRWDAVDAVLLDIATGTRATTGIILIFTTDKIRYEFNLNFATAMASLKIVRL